MSSTETTGEALTSDDRTMGALAHLSSFAGVVLPGIGHILGPLIFWMVKRDSSPFAAEHAKEALNFQITATVTLMVGLLGVVFTMGLGIFVYLPMVLVFAVVDLVCTILAAIKAYDGQMYSYPFCLKWI